MFLENVQKEETKQNRYKIEFFELSQVTNKHIIDLVVERLTTILIKKCASNFRTKL